MAEPGRIRDALAKQVSGATYIRTFLTEHFQGRGWYEMRRDARYHAPEPWMIVPCGDSDPHTMRTSAEWLLKFLVHPSPDLSLAYQGADLCGEARVGVRDALDGIAALLGVPVPQAPHHVSIGAPKVNDADPTLLARGCWALALLSCWAPGIGCDTTYLERAAIRRGPLGRFTDAVASVDDLLGLAPQDAVNQLAAFRHIYATRLLPRLTRGRGSWTVGPRLAGMRYVSTSPALIAEGVLVDVKTPIKWMRFQPHDLMRLIACALLDFDDEYGITGIGVFSARYAEWQGWGLESVLRTVAVRDLEIDLPDLRDRFRVAAAKRAY